MFTQGAAVGAAAGVRLRQRVGGRHICCVSADG